MKKRKSLIVCAIGGLILLAVTFGVLLSQPNDDANRYKELLRVRRAEARFIHWRTNAAYRFVSRVTRYDLISRFGQKADKLETSLRKSGGLVTMTFLSKGAPAQLNLKSARMRYYPNEGFWFVSGEQRPDSNTQYVRCNFRNEGQITLLCRPKDSPFWQTTLCCITNRVRWGELWKLGGTRELPCGLPDGSIVELDAARNWLNDSVTAGWMVGVRLEINQQGQNLLVATRSKPGGEVE